MLENSGRRDTALWRGNCLTMYHNVALHVPLYVVVSLYTMNNKIIFFYRCAMHLHNVKILFYQQMHLLLNM